MKMATSIVAMLLTLTACGSWPQFAASPRSNTSDVWPTLLPIGDIAGASNDQSSQSAARALSARAAALRARAQIMRQSVPDQDAFEALRARLAR